MREPQRSERPRSFGAARRGEPTPQDAEFPERIVVPAMVLKPVELPVVLTIDPAMLDKTLQMVTAKFHEAAARGLQQAVEAWGETLDAADAAFGAPEPVAAE